MLSAMPYWILSSVEMYQTMAVHKRQQSLPERDRLMKKREYLEDQIAVLLGGRAAEQVLLSTMTAGASNDIQRAVEIARSMVSEFGMSPLGPIYVADPRNGNSGGGYPGSAFQS